MALRPVRSHRVEEVIARNGRLSSTAERSGWLMAHDFAAISPTTMWRNTTTATASTVAIAAANASGRGSAP